MKLPPCLGRRREGCYAGSWREKVTGPLVQAASDNVPELGAATTREAFALRVRRGAGGLPAGGCKGGASAVFGKPVGDSSQMLNTTRQNESSVALTE